MLLLLQQNLGFAWGSVDAITVPDVVGQSEASATTDIEAEGLTVSVTTAYSDVVAAGLVISQDPIGGAEVAPGSNVAIVVSLGSAPVAPALEGGGGFYFDFGNYSERRRQRQKELDDAEEEAARLQNKIDREIAELLHDQERKDEKRKDLERIKALVKRYESVSPVEVNSERVMKALEQAKKKATTANLERLQKEFERMQEEEDFLSLLVLIAND